MGLVVKPKINNGGSEEPSVVNINVGDVAYYTNGEIKTISKDKWNSSLGTPIGVVVIPSNFLPDGKARIISLKAVNSSGNASTSHSSMYWGAYGTDTTLTNYTKVPITNNTGSVSSSSNSYGYLPSDNFTGDTSFVDGSAKYGTTNTNKIPSPYNGSEFNTDYSKTISGYNNALSDFNGLNNTQVLVGLGSDYVAANAAYNYNDGVSNTQWYLPSCGELGFMMARLKTINNTISQLGGVAIVHNYFWSSTKKNNGYIYYMYTYHGQVDSKSNSSYNYVRPFALLDIGGTDLTTLFPCYLTGSITPLGIIDNGEIGIQLYNYLRNKYSNGIWSLASDEKIYVNSTIVNKITIYNDYSNIILGEYNTIDYELTSDGQVYKPNHSGSAN